MASISDRTLPSLLPMLTGLPTTAVYQEGISLQLKGWWHCYLLAAPHNIRDAYQIRQVTLYSTPKSPHRMSSKVQDCRRRFSPDTKGTMKKETISHQGMFLHKPSKLEKLSPFSPHTILWRSISGSNLSAQVQHLVSALFADQEQTPPWGHPSCRNTSHSHSNRAVGAPTQGTAPLPAVSHVISDRVKISAARSICRGKGV